MNNSRLYAGIDLHKKYTFVTIMDHQGYIQNQGRYENSENTLIPALLACGKEVEAVVESTYGWYWLGDKLEEAKIPFFLAHPQKVNAISGKKKTDREDSQNLAHLLRSNLLPMSYIPTKTEREVKELLRFRMQFVNQLSTVKRRLRDILAKQNMVCSYKDVLGGKAGKWFGDHVFAYPYDQEIQTLLVYARELQNHIRMYTDDVVKHAQSSKDAEL